MEAGISTRPTLAPGGPGIPARWTSSAKTGVGCALSVASPLWFTLARGIVNEVYFPRLDSACIRDFGFLVTAKDGYFAEEKRDCQVEQSMVEPGIPAFTFKNTAHDGKWSIVKRVVSDPMRPCLLQQVQFSPSSSSGADEYTLHALIAPHLVNAGAQNTAWIANHHGHEVLFATGHGTALAVVSSAPFLATSAGFVGTSDGWQQLRSSGVLDCAYTMAENGNVALTGSINPNAGPITLALAFGVTPEEAADLAIASLNHGFEAAWDGTIANWREWHEKLVPLDEHDAREGASYRISACVLATHLAQIPSGAAIASLSIPWGQSKGDNDLGGYHLVWPRDMCETATAFLAAGDVNSARAILGFLQENQLPEGNWAQNMWLDGEPYWNGQQLDETGFPILLADHLHRLEQFSSTELAAIMPMIRRAAAYLLYNGPVTGEDRWEENAGYSPFTLAVIISAMLAAADLFDITGAQEHATHLRETADCWNEQIEAWTFVPAPDATDEDVGHYVRLSNPDATDHASPLDDTIQILNRQAGQPRVAEANVVSPDAFALARFGLRDAKDPKLTSTARKIDASLKVDFPYGPIWHRYNDDGYGEHPDGKPFDGCGVGRVWPLLTGERAHFEIAAGRVDQAHALLRTLESSAGVGGMIPEQVWDSDDIPAFELHRGRPSGSAMPLVWAHSEHIKLLRSLRDGEVFDMPPQGIKRYIRDGVTSPIRIWRFNNRISRLHHGKQLRIEVRASAMIHWGHDGWQDVTDVNTEQSAFSTHFVDLPVNDMPVGTQINFTFFWHGSGKWEGADYVVEIAP